MGENFPNLDPNDIAAKIAVDLSSKAMDSLVKFGQKRKDDFQKYLTKKSIDSGKRIFEEYLNRTYERYCKVKTLLSRREPQNLFNFYVPMDVIFFDENMYDPDKHRLSGSRSTIVNSLDFQKLFSRGNKLIVSGTGGIGKTFFMKSLLLNSLINSIQVPIFIELRTIGELENEQDVEAAIYNIVSNLGLKLDFPFFQYALESGAFLILFDGFDEIKNENKETFEQSIRNFSTKYPDNHYVVSSRPDKSFVGWNDFEETEIRPLTKTQAKELVKKLPVDKQSKEAFIEELDEKLYDSSQFESFCEIPLLLTIMVITFESGASMPETLESFYEQAFLTLFKEHDALKGVYKRDLKTKLGYIEFKNIFAYICSKTYFQEKFSFSETEIVIYISDAIEKNMKSHGYEFSSFDYLDDLTDAVCMLIQDGINIIFTHRSFQEYFAAFYVAKLTDEMQVKYVSALLEKKRSYNSETTFFSCLESMQSERYKRNVIYPVLDFVKNDFENDTFEIFFEKQILNVVPLFAEAVLDSIIEEENTWKINTDFIISIEWTKPHFWEIVNHAVKLSGREDSRNQVKYAVLAKKFLSEIKKNPDRIERRLDKEGEEQRVIVDDNLSISDVEKLGLKKDFMETVLEPLKRNLEISFEWMMKHQEFQKVQESDFFDF